MPSLSEIESKRVEKAVERFLEKRRPPEHSRIEVDLIYRIAGNSVEIVEVRADWQDPSRKIDQPVAKATRLSTGRWKIYWQRSDGRWHAYRPVSEVATIDEFTQIVDRDAQGCFFG